MRNLKNCFLFFLPIFFIEIQSQQEELRAILGKCRKSSNNFDQCIKNAFNELRVFFTTGLPDYNVAPFDPHHAQYVELRRGDASGIGGYRLLLTNASEYGWSKSYVTKYRTDAENNRIIYSQYFPEKSLEGYYDFTAKVLGKPFHTKGNWNMTLYEYSQTTSVTKVGGPGGLIKVRIEIDKIGDLSLHAMDLFGGKFVIEKIADFLINNIWQPGFPFLKPLINDLISSAFTDIFNESFRRFPIDEFILD